MAKIVAKIVLTGGPCAGKTTALSRIEEDLTEKGYHVFIVPESATEFISGGIRPFGSCPLDGLDFQELLMKYQLQKEHIYEEAASLLPEDKNCVIICDRGCIDNKAYMSNREFKQLLIDLNLNTIDLLDRYDQIIHLVTAADGKEEYYTLENNQSRTETPEQAIALDQATLKAWMGHSHLQIIDNSTDFSEKIHRVLASIHQFLGDPIPLRKQRKFLIDLKNSSLDQLKPISTIIDIKQFYLLDENSDWEKRLRKRSLDGANTYYLTVQRKGPKGNNEICTERKISEREYYSFLEQSARSNVLQKKRYCFSQNKQYFTLDQFDDVSDYAILEIEPTKENQQIVFPESLRIIEEVTDRPDYQNYSLAQKDTAKRPMQKVL